MSETKTFSKVLQFWYQNVLSVLTKKTHTHAWYFHSKIKALEKFEILNANIANVENPTLSDNLEGHDVERRV